MEGGVSSSSTAVSGIVFPLAFSNLILGREGVLIRGIGMSLLRCSSAAPPLRRQEASTVYIGAPECLSCLEHDLRVLSRGESLA